MRSASKKRSGGSGRCLMRPVWYNAITPIAADAVSDSATMPRRRARLGVSSVRSSRLISSGSCTTTGNANYHPAMHVRHRERHRTGRIGWLRAAVLGANDGIVSTASLVVGVAAANTTRPEVLLAGIAGLVAGSLSMAAGEYVSVS